jgi:hypothetical protein
MYYEYGKWMELAHACNVSFCVCLVETSDFTIIECVVFAVILISAAKFTFSVNFFLYLTRFLVACFKSYSGTDSLSTQIACSSVP